MFIEFTFSSLKFAMLHFEDANAAHVIRATCKINNHDTFHASKNDTFI